MPHFQLLALLNADSPPKTILDQILAQPAIHCDLTTTFKQTLNLLAQNSYDVVLIDTALCPPNLDFIAELIVLDTVASIVVVAQTNHLEIYNDSRVRAALSYGQLTVHSLWQNLRQALDYSKLLREKQKLAARLNVYQHLGSEAVLHCDAEMRIQYVSPNSKRILGVSAENLIGHHALEYVPEEDWNDVIAHGRQIFAENNPISFSYRAYTEEGNLIWLNCTIHVVLGEHGELLGTRSLIHRVEDLAVIETTLNRERANISSITDQIPNPLLRLDTSLRIIYANGALARYAGVSVDKLLGLHFSTLVIAGQPDIFADWAPKLEMVFRRGKPLNTEFVIDHVEGPIMLVMSIVPERHVYGETDTLLLMFTDVSEQRKAEVSALNSHLMTHGVFNSMYTSIMVLGLESEIVDINLAWRQLYGQTDENLRLIGRNFQHLWDDLNADIEIEDNNNFLPNAICAVGSGASSRISQTHYLAFANRWVITSITRVENIVPPCLVVTHEDITQQVLAEKAAQEQGQFAEALRQISLAFVNARDLDSLLSVILEKVGQVVPHDAANICLIRGESVYFKYWRGYPPDMDAVMPTTEIPLGAHAKIRSIYATNEPVLIADTHAPDSGWNIIFPTHPIRSYIGLPISMHDQVLGFLNIDSWTPNFFNEVSISRLKAFAAQVALALENANLYRDLENTVQNLEQQVEARTQEITKLLTVERDLNATNARISSMISHEYGNVLTIISSSNDVLNKFGDRITEEKKSEHHDKISRAVRRMKTLSADILELGKAQAGKLDLSCHPTDLPTLCHSIAREIVQSLDGSHAITFLDQSNGALTAVMIDVNKIWGVVSNLLNNAAKYSQPGSTITLQLGYQPGTAFIHVTDQGIGIPDADQPNLFKPYYRATNTGGIKGTGLGLLIAKQAVEAHGGQLGFRSQVGVGTTFTIILPIDQQFAPSVPTPFGEAG
jgi:PAS domain S-box-containing protein